MLVKFVLPVFAFSLLITSGLAEPSNVSYAIVGPKELRPGSAYNLTVTCYNAVADVELELSIVNSNNATLVQATQAVVAGETRIISLQIPAVVPAGGQYELVAKGRGGLTFSNKTKLTVNRKTLLLFVQTDKATYKPGQKVLFRVISVYSDLKPYKDLVDIAMFDLAGNKIMQWLQQRNDTGVITQSLKLSDQTPLGEWKIVVTAGENSYTKTFVVAEYVLPKFEVSLALPSFFLVNTKNPEWQKDFQATVSARYTYGQPVKGTATVDFIVKDLWAYGSEPAKKTVTVLLENGKADVQLKFRDLQALAAKRDSQHATHWTSYRILVSAQMEESVSRIVQTANGTVNIVTTKHNLQFLDLSPSNFKPGLLYTGFLHLSKTDGSPPDYSDIKLPDGTYRSLSVKATSSVGRQYGYYPGSGPSSSSTEQFDVTIHASGYVKFTMMIAANVSSVSLEATFHETTTSQTVTTWKSISPFKSRDNQTIQVSFDSEHGTIKVPDIAQFSVKTTHKINSFQYGVMSKGNIIFSETVNAELSNEHSFSISITRDLATKLAPSARVVVWTITPNGEVVSDSTEVSVNDIFANKVKLSFNRQSTTPSENVSLTVNADQGSYVGLLAVDQSVLLLKSGNDITEDMVLSELKEYSGSAKMPYAHGFGRGKRSIWWPYFIDGSNSDAIFDKSGLFVLTDGFIYKGIDDYYGIYDMAVPARNGEVMRGGFAEADDSDVVYSSGSVEEPIKLRLNFPETWLWTDAYTGPDGSVTLQTSVPDTITSWIASAFAISEVTGLGVASDTAKVTVFKKFFISPNLPYSIKRGEEFALQVQVFNYLPQSVDVLLTIKESEYFSVMNSSKSITVDSDDASSAYFWIVAKSLGQIPIEISAQSPLAGDAMRVMLLVKPEGVQQTYSTSTFVQLTASQPTFTTTMQVSLPPEGKLVPGSEHIELTVIGDIMGPSVNGLDNLLQMPYGCGEQNMLNFAPDVYIVKYLTIADQLTNDIKEKALAFMIAGYQRELTYQRNEGSFSAFGNHDAAGSVWLSAFVIKCFHQAKDYIAVDDSKIAETMRWIIANQATAGSFAEPPNGRVCHTEMQGGSSKGLAMTAYVLIALLENSENDKVDAGRLRSSIASAQQFLESQVSSVASDPYALSIISYALARANSSRVSDVLLMLEALAKVEAGTRHWEKASDAKEDESRNRWRPPYSQARAVNIETTSYALLTYCHLNDISKSVPIVKWIIAQRNANGGFSSTQDTVMALEALSAFAAMTVGSSGERNLQITAKVGSTEYKFPNRITAQTSLLLQSYQLPSDATEVSVTATGTGSALIQLNVLYHVQEMWDISGISLKVNTLEKKNGVTINSCGKWTKNEASGMVVMEINQLTGFKAANVDQLKNQANNVLKRVENDEGKVILYFDELTSEETCVTIISEKVIPVSNLQDASIKVYPYYDPSGARTALYSAPKNLAQKSPCEECPQCCGMAPPVGSSPAIRSYYASIVVAVLWICIFFA